MGPIQVFFKGDSPTPESLQPLRRAVPSPVSYDDLLLHQIADADSTAAIMERQYCALTGMFQAWRAAAQQAT